MRILIDGHNAIGALKLRGRTREEIREKLLRIVAARTRYATVYFDAQNAPPDLLGDRRRQLGVDVVYCRKMEADDRILRAVRDAENARSLTVVTNDRKVAGIARQHRARTVGVREYFGSPPPDEEDGPRRPPSRIVRLTPKDFGLPEKVDLDDPDLD